MSGNSKFSLINTKTKKQLLLYLSDKCEYNSDFVKSPKCFMFAIKMRTVNPFMFFLGLVPFRTYQLLFKHSYFGVLKGF